MGRNNAKGSNSATITKTVNIVFTGNKPDETIYQFDLSNLPLGIGQMLNKIVWPAYFVFMGHKINVPSLTSKVSNRERAANVYSQIVAKFFPADMPSETVLSSDTEEAKVLMTLHKAGFKFKSLCRAQVAESIEVKKKLWKQAVRTEQLIVRDLNKSDIAATKVLKTANDKLAAKLLSDITGLEAKAAKKIEATLPNVIEDTLPAN